MPLKPTDLAALGAAMTERRKELVEEIRAAAARARGETYAVLAGSTHDSGDESVADLIADLGQAEIGRDVTELGDLDAAADRLAAGTYGLCADCGVEIDLGRLWAQPAALRCRTCQDRYEKTHAPRSGRRL